MKIQVLVCPSCNGAIKYDESLGKTVQCEHCNNTIIVDDGVKRSHIEIDTNINKTSRKYIIDEAKVAELKNQRLLICAIVVLLIFSLIASYYFYNRNNTSDSVITLNESESLYARFQDAIVLTAQEQALLIVYEQEMSTDTTITQEGWIKWSIFQKNQPVTFYGTAQYTVDLSRMKKEDIVFDEAKNMLTVKVLKPELHDVVFNSDKTAFGDSKNGWLAFGDIKMSAEQSNAVEKEAITKLKEKANEENNLSKARSSGKTVLEDVFKMAVGNIDDSTKLQVEFF